MNVSCLYCSEEADVSAFENGPNQANEPQPEEEHPPSDDEKAVKVTSSTEMQEMYAVTPPASFTDSSEEDDGDGCTEISPLVRDESKSSAEQPEPSTSKRTSWETRPLLLRQPEIDQTSQSSNDANLNSLHDIDQEDDLVKNSEESLRTKIPNALNLVKSDDEVESQRVMPILFTLSPTKKGANQIVSVVATRELPAAFSRTSSLPNSPNTRKPKSPKIPRSPKSPRSPNTPRSFRAIFGCHTSSGKDIADNDNEVNPKTSNGSISVTATENCIDEKDSKNTFAENSNIDKISAQNLTNGDMQIDSEETTHTACMPNGKITFTNTETQNKVVNASNPNGLHLGAHEANVPKSSLAEDAMIVLHSEPLPPRVPILSHRTTAKDSLSEKGSNANDSFEESTNNSDKGYESVDNSPCVDNEENTCRSRNNGSSVQSNGLSKLDQHVISENVLPEGLDDITVISNEATGPKRSVWVPLMDSRVSLGRKEMATITAGQRDSNLFSQTAV